jgi:hypothetical protein
MSYSWLSLILAGLGAGGAVDLAKVERTLAKEPAYQSKAPRYGLLAFGPQAERRVWLVLDRDTLYVDANGNGDLTEPGERVKVKTPDQDPASFEDLDILGQDGQKPQKLRFALYGWFNVKQGKDEGVQPSITVSWGGKWYGAWGDGDSPLVFAARPQDAPILHVGGPLEMGFESRVENAFRKKGQGEYELAVGVGTRGLGKGAFTHLTYWDDGIPKDARPTAELEFPSKQPGGPPVKVKQVLKERC